MIAHQVQAGQVAAIGKTKAQVRVHFRSRLFEPVQSESPQGEWLQIGPT